MGLSSSSSRKQFVIPATLSCSFSTLPVSGLFVLQGFPLSDWDAECPQQREQPSVASRQGRKLTLCSVASVAAGDKECSTDGGGKSICVREGGQRDRRGHGGHNESYF
ncbi:unnamed protein product [Pleuronectes platessa]|uniref:Uncharacterized protein n=1 Tax=Pleuronectes platessa TaxID=8262 RepID=A0A9N7TR36_PLEPL|nr:unnamed protein product [Pleuronectes platessa]